MAVEMLSQAALRHRPRLAILVALLVAIFVADTLTDLEIAVAVFYTAVILLAIGLLPRRGVVALAWLCVVLTLLSFALTPHGVRESGVINAAISVSAIGMTTYLALMLVAAQAAAHESRAQLARIARVTSLGELTASIAHEVNQPLAAIVTSANACQRWLELESPNLDKARHSVERIIDDANRASAVIERVRRLAKGETPRKEWLNLNEAIGEAVALARDEIARRAIALRVDLAPDLPPVLGDPVQLQQVVANLVINAMEALTNAPPGAHRALDVSSRADAGLVVFAIADSGVGLPPHALDHLFDAFWTTKEGGVGIGLTISRSIIEAHGGRIWATPGSPAGAVFQFSLPAGGGAK